MKPKEVKEAVRLDIMYVKKLSREEAANLLEMGPQTLSNLLSQPRYFTHKMASRIHEKFGYNIAFLMCGEGKLSDDEFAATITDVNKAIQNNSRQKQKDDYPITATISDLFNSKSPAEVKTEISTYFKIHKITQKEIARKLGYKNRQSISNIISDKHYMSPKQAFKFSEKYPFNVEFLRYGLGELIYKPSPEFPKNIEFEKELDYYKRLCATQNETIRSQQETIRLLLSRPTS